MSAWPRYPGKREAVGGETVSARAQLVVTRSSLSFFCPVGAHTSTSQRLEQNGITDYLGIKIVGHQARGQRPGCRTHTVPGRPGCGPGLGLTWPASLDPGTIITVGFRKASVILAYADATCTVVVPFSRVFTQARVMSQYAGITPVSDCGSVYAHRVPIVEVAAPFDKMTIFFEL